MKLPQVLEKGILLFHLLRPLWVHASSMKYVDQFSPSFTSEFPFEFNELPIAFLRQTDFFHMTTPITPFSA